VDQECRVYTEPRRMYSCGQWVSFRSTGSESRQFVATGRQQT